MKNDMVKNWFKDNFSELDPLLQKLHIYGGELHGKIEISYGKGLAGLVGKRLAKKMKLPNEGCHDLLVSISHSEEGLHWLRRFNQDSVVESLFVPHGCLTDGYWIEKTGPMEMKLTVDIVDGGWFWRCLNIRLFGLPIPIFLIPKSQAYKVIENGKYNFSVSFTYPVLGNLVSYKGLLNAKYND